MSKKTITKKTQKDFRAIAQVIVRYANAPLMRTEFLEKVTAMLQDFSSADRVDVFFREGNDDNRFVSAARMNGMFRTEMRTKAQIEETMRNHDARASELLAFERHQNSTQAHIEPIFLFLSATELAEQSFRSHLLIPLTVGDHSIGVLSLHGNDEDALSQERWKRFEDIGSILGFALDHRRINIQLRERVKELTCLYGIAHLAVQPGKSLDYILQKIVELLPPAWLYPEIATARIVLDREVFALPGYTEGVAKQSSDIIVNGLKRGMIEVVYLQKTPDIDEGPFLREERSLINTIANEISLIIQRGQAEEEDKNILQNQIRHADRLATFGFLAAGVAHEINEPLGNILGYAQLAKKGEGSADQVAVDIDKIIAATLHAREVMKKLMLFARQMPPKKVKVNFNDIVKEGLYFLEGRCLSSGIHLTHVLSPDIPEFTADPAQLYQVLVNLVVNAIQAMPLGGDLTVSAYCEAENVVLSVQDTGVGMTEETMKQIFIPFFTTKDIGEGTGLGLSVAHGIVTSHGGTITVESEPSKGSTFRILLPLFSTKRNDPQEN